MIRDSKRGIVAGVPEGTDIINCRQDRGARADRHARLCRRASASHRETCLQAGAAAGGITTIICQPDTSPVIDNWRR
jgi:dihydroorotase